MVDIFCWHGSKSMQNLHHIRGLCHRPDKVSWWIHMFSLVSVHLRFVCCMQKHGRLRFCVQHKKRKKQKGKWSKPSPKETIAILFHWDTFFKCPSGYPRQRPRMGPKRGVNLPLHADFALAFTICIALKSLWIRIAPFTTDAPDVIMA